MLRHAASAASLRARAAASAKATATATLSAPPLPSTANHAANAGALFRRNLVSSVLLSSTRDSYENKRMAELKQELKSRGLSSSGRKEDLVRRLLDSDSARAGSNLVQSPEAGPVAPASRPRSKSTLASLRPQPDSDKKKPNATAAVDAAAAPSSTTVKTMTEASKPTTGGEQQPATQTTLEGLAGKGGSPLGSLKPSETPANLEPGSVHNAAADGLAGDTTAKASPTPAPEDPAIATNPPGLPPQKAPQPRETFNVRIPYYEEPVPPEAPIPVVTSYTSFTPPSQGRNQVEEEVESSVPKVYSISADSTFSGAGVSHDELQRQEPAEAAKSILGEILADLQIGSGSGSSGRAASTGSAASKALGSIAAQAKDVLEQASRPFSQSAGSGSASASSSQSASGASGRSANRPLTDEERSGAWVLLGIVSSGFLLGGLGKAQHEKGKTAGDGHGEHGAQAKPADAGGKTGQTVKVASTGRREQPGAGATEVAGVTPSGSSVRAPIMCVPKGTQVAVGGTVPLVPAGAGLSESTLAQLARLSTCEVSDALIKLKVPNGGHLPGIEMFSPGHLEGETRICGPAFTVRMVSQEDTSSPRPARHFVDAAPPDSVMVVAAPSDVRSAIWGGLMTARAQFLGVKGVVLDGRCRDLSEHREAGFPVFARGHSTLGQSPFTRPSELQVSLTIRDPSLGADASFAPLTVEPGDYVLADLDGVVVVPVALAGKVVELANKARRTDELCMLDLKAGKGVAETFKARRGK